MLGKQAQAVSVARSAGRADLKVLLVDTNSEALQALAAALEQAGFTSDLATDGPEALQRWRTGQPDLVVLEVELPRLSGFDVCRQIREKGSTPVLFLSVLSGHESIVEGFRAGADDWLTKPCSPQEVVGRLRAVWRQVVEAPRSSLKAARPLSP